MERPRLVLGPNRLTGPLVLPPHKYNWLLHAGGERGRSQGRDLAHELARQGLAERVDGQYTLVSLSKAP